MIETTYTFTEKTAHKNNSVFCSIILDILSSSHDVYKLPLYDTNWEAAI
jgi:hypothetical protein